MKPMLKLVVSAPCGIAFVLLLAAGCASKETAQTTANAVTSECKQTYRMGSHIASQSCESAMTDEERQRMTAEMQTGIKANIDVR